jgi:hypothetical protein
MTKRQNKTETDVLADLREQQLKKFFEAYNEAVKPVFKQYGYCIVPIIKYTEQGVFPVLAADTYKAPLDTQPEADTGADTNDQTPKE